MTTDPDLTTILGLETEVWQALVAGDPDLDGRLLAEDFLGVYPDGFAGRDTHVGQLANGPTVATYELSDARLMVIDADTALLAYRAEYVRPGATESEAMYVSSLWRRRDGQWVNIFSQDTAEVIGYDWV